jgi:exosortase/archaeosortase family protein
MVSGVDTLITRNGTILKDEVEWIYRGPFKTLSIADVCNGLELMVLYAGFLLCWPAGSVRKIKFIAGGFLLIVLLNILRCAALALISVHKPQYVDFYHHYLFTFLIYGCIFLLWYLFTLDPVVSQKRLQHVPTGK